MFPIRLAFAAMLPLLALSSFAHAESTPELSKAVATSAQPQPTVKILGTSYRGKTIVADSSTVVFSDSSEVAREGKLGYVATGFGLNSVTDLNSTFSAFAFVNPDLAVGSELHLGFEDKSNKRNIWIASALLQAYFGNSFFLNSGISYQSLSESVISESGTIRGRMTTFGADLAIGNRWQWDSFTLGCTWAHFIFPMKDLTSSFEGGSERERKEAEESISIFTERYRFLAFQLTMGMAF